MSDLIAPGWEGYELIDAGDGHRLERFGPYTVVRPDPNILWSPENPRHPAWSRPDFRYDPHATGYWEGNEDLVRAGWVIRYKGASLRVKPTPFRHMGVFPEQSPQWDAACEAVRSSGRRVRVLNLFAYTGAASVLLAQAGAAVCHVDASKGSMMWAKENARLSGLPDDAVRWIVDDVLKFMRREVRRGSAYDLILMDPPVFGRGPQGEIWRLEERLPELADLARQLLSDAPVGVFLNFYATALYPESVRRAVAGILPFDLTLSMVGIRETTSKKVLQTGFCLSS